MNARVVNANLLTSVCAWLVRRGAETIAKEKLDRLCKFVQFCLWKNDDVGIQSKSLCYLFFHTVIQISIFEVHIRSFFTTAILRTI